MNDLADNNREPIRDLTTDAATLHLELLELRQRLAALESTLPQRQPTVRKGRRVSRKMLSLLVAVAVLAAATIVFGEDAVDALFVSKDGKVGIGTTSPTNKLSVAGNTDVSGNLSVTGNVSTNKLSVTGNGDFSNVGIGTNAPAAKLDIKDRIVLQDANGRNYFKDTEKNDGKGLRVGALWSQYGIFAETGMGAVGGADGVTLQNGALTINGAGLVSTSGDLSVGRFVSSKGRYQRDNQGETTSSLSPRYHMSLTGGAYARSSKRIPQDVINDLCGDADGCEYRLGMTRWDDDNLTETASRMGLFYYSSNGRWRSNEDQIGMDGNKTTEHVKNVWDTCYLTDADYSNGSNQDNDKGLSLLVWTGYGNAGRTCELTLID